MKLDQAVIRDLRVQPGHHAHLQDRPTRSQPSAGKGGQGKRAGRTAADAELHDYVEELEAAQGLLYASATHAVLMILQGLDAAGKDGTIKHVLSGVNPQGVEVTPFKQPTTEERRHDFLWRVSRALPGRGTIGIFNRSHYEDVLVVRVHPELLSDGAAGEGGAEIPEEFWQERFDDINGFERHLARGGTRVVKLFLHISLDEQKQRFLARLDDPSKRWKFSESDLAERAYWPQYQAAYEAAISATSTPWAPWYVVPADDKHTCRALVAGILAHTIDELGLEMPKVGPEQLKRIEAARAQLLAE